MSKIIDQLKSRARQLKREVAALYFAYRDARTPWLARIFALLVVSYALSPIDLIPDFIPVLGYLDDLILVPTGITLALKMIPAEVMADAHQRASDPVQSEKIGWIFTVIIIVIWALVAILIVISIQKWFASLKA
jgi:uncharacterized membrane protein YkvA (DUF1232 family)